MKYISSMQLITTSIPIGSIYGIYGVYLPIYIYHKDQANVGKYAMDPMDMI